MVFFLGIKTFAFHCGFSNQRNKRKREDSAIRFVYDLPSAVLGCVGSFLGFADCIKAVRTCKNNENLQAILAGVTTAFVGTSRFVNLPILFLII